MSFKTFVPNNTVIIFDSVRPSFFRVPIYDYLRSPLNTIIIELPSETSKPEFAFFTFEEDAVFARSRNLRYICFLSEEEARSYIDSAVATLASIK